MIGNAPSSMPDPHRRSLARLVDGLRRDERIVGVAAGGSYVADAMDEFSDLDLVVAVEHDAYDAVMPDRRAIAATLGRLLAAFTGEHVGEPRLLICLYDDPLMHVDLKFVRLADSADRVEDPAVLWERDGRLSAALARGHASFPGPDPEWIEDRFWVWVHYAATKIGRGELFDAVDHLAFLRATVLGPLALERAGGRPAGVRRIEEAAPEFADRLRATVARYDAADCMRALRVCVELYRSVRPGPADDRAEQAAMAYVQGTESRFRLGENGS